MGIALIGRGGLGRAVELAAAARGHRCTVFEQRDGNPITPDAARGLDVAIDCSLGEAVIPNLEACIAAKLDVVIASTGWHDRLEQVRRLVEGGGIGALWSANLSLGVHLYLRLVEAAADLADRLDEYDVWVTELHHANKVDSPSGTARRIGEVLLERIARKRAVVTERLDRRRRPDEIHIASARGGAVNYAHTVGLDSESDTITLTHSARDRQGYARGAVAAAEWVRGRRGLHTMDDLLAGLLDGEAG